MADEDAIKQLIQILIGAFEEEASVKLDRKQWNSVAPDIFRLCINRGKEFTIDEINSRGICRIFLEETLFHRSEELSEAAKQSLASAFQRRLCREIIAIYSGPPKLTFQWRHWGTFEGKLKDHSPLRLSIEIFGIAVATVNEELKLTRLEYFFDSDQFLQNIIALERNSRPAHDSAMSAKVMALF